MADQTSLSPITGIVLAGTHPWAAPVFDRLLPRPLLPVALRPLISYPLTWLHEGGIRNVTICANRETQALEARVERHVPAGMGVTYLQDPMPRGAAGSIRDAAEGSSAEILVVADATSIPTVKLRELLEAHERSGALATVVVHVERNRQGAELRVPTGVYVFSRRVLSFVPPRGFYDLKESLLPRLYRANERVATFEAAASPRVLDATTYLAVNEWMVEQTVAGPIPEGYVRSGDSLVHADAFVARDAVLVGPVLVGPGARVMSGAVVVGPASIARDVTVEPGAFVSRSAVWRRSIVGENASADRCLLADDTVLAASAQASRTVLTSTGAKPQELPDDVKLPELPSAPSLELYRRVVRGLFAPSWSRSSTAQ